MTKTGSEGELLINSDAVSRWVWCRFVGIPITEPYDKEYQALFDKVEELQRNWFTRGLHEGARQMKELSVDTKDAQPNQPTPNPSEVGRCETHGKYDAHCVFCQLAEANRFGDSLEKTNDELTELTNRIAADRDRLCFQNGTLLMQLANAANAQKQAVEAAYERAAQAAEQYPEAEGYVVQDIAASIRSIAKAATANQPTETAPREGE